MNFVVLSGTSNRNLAEKISKQNSMIQLAPSNIRKFADGEVWCQIEKSVRGNDVFIIQSTCTPVNDNLMELFVLADACRRASPKSITAVIPYFGYARQDRKTRPRVPITAALVARLIETAGVNRVVSLDLHCGQIQGFFPTIPVDNLYGQGTLAQAIYAQITGRFKKNGTSPSSVKQDGVPQLQTSPLMDKGITIVSPDAGGMERADYFRKCFRKASSLTCNMAMLNKKREEHNKVSKMELIGEVEGTLCIIVDDMIDTAGTLCLAASKLVEAGATEVICAASHGLFNGPALERIHKSNISEVYVLDTIPMGEKKMEASKKNGWTKIKYISVAKLLGEAIIRINRGMSIGALFDDEEL